MAAFYEYYDIYYIYVYTVPQLLVTYEVYMCVYIACWIMYDMITLQVKHRLHM